MSLRLLRCRQNAGTDWQAQQTPQLVYSLAGAELLWGSLWTWSDQRVTVLIGCRKEEWRKDEVYSLSSEVLIICDQPHQRWYSFKGKLGETTERRGRACMGLSEHCDAILSWNWKLKASHSGTVDSMNMTYIKQHCYPSHSQWFKVVRYWLQVHATRNHKRVMCPNNLSTF